MECLPPPPARHPAADLAWTSFAAALTYNITLNNSDVRPPLLSLCLALLPRPLATPTHACADA